MAATRKTHSPEFKAKLVVEVLKEQQTVQEITASHDLNPNLLFKQRKEFLDHPERVFGSASLAAATGANPWRGDAPMSASRDDGAAEPGARLAEETPRSDALRGCRRSFRVIQIGAGNSVLFLM